VDDKLNGGSPDVEDHHPVRRALGVPVAEERGDSNALAVRGDRGQRVDAAGPEVRAGQSTVEDADGLPIGGVEVHALERELPAADLGLVDEVVQVAPVRRDGGPGGPGLVCQRMQGAAVLDVTTQVAVLGVVLVAPVSVGRAVQHEVLAVRGEDLGLHVHMRTGEALRCELEGLETGRRPLIEQIGAWLHE